MTRSMNGSIFEKSEELILEWKRLHAEVAFIADPTGLGEAREEETDHGA